LLTDLTARIQRDRLLIVSQCRLSVSLQRCASYC